MYVTLYCVSAQTGQAERVVWPHERGEPNRQTPEIDSLNPWVRSTLCDL